MLDDCSDGRVFYPPVHRDSIVFFYNVVKTSNLPNSILLHNLPACDTGGYEESYMRLPE
jgi:hypothetical protein